jgi:hypothetical protein
MFVPGEIHSQEMSSRDPKASAVSQVERSAVLSPFSRVPARRDALVLADKSQNPDLPHDEIDLTLGRKLRIK